MIVAINCRQLTHHKLEGFGNYTFELVSRWIRHHPEVRFILLFDRQPKVHFPEYSHVKKVIIGPATRHPLLYWMWFEWSIPKVLRQEKVEIFFSPDGYNSLRANIPSIITVHDLNFEHNPKDLPFVLATYLRLFFPKFVEKATHVVTVSKFSRDDIISTYGCKNSKISAVHNGSNELYRPLSEERKVQIRTKICQGRPYFLFVGSLHPRKNIDRLLKAYLTMENPSVDMVIVGSAMWNEVNFKIDEERKSRIHFLGYLEREFLVEVMGGALALTYVPYFEGFGIPLVEAMSCGTPILCSRATCLPEVAGDAAIYCDPLDERAILDGLYRLQNEPDLLEKLSQKGLERSKQFSWDASAETVWRLLKTTLST